MKQLILAKKGDSSWDDWGYQEKHSLIQTRKKLALLSETWSSSVGGGYLDWLFTGVQGCIWRLVGLECCQSGLEVNCGDICARRGRWLLSVDESHAESTYLTVSWVPLRHCKGLNMDSENKFYNLFHKLVGHPVLMHPSIILHASAQDLGCLTQG